ncbi:MAG: amidohydrolase family protein [Oscillospiraceae bacterium]
MKDFIIKCGMLINGTGEPPMKNVEILIKNGKIAKVEAASNKSENRVNVIDASKMTVLPGLIDAHKHITNCGGSGIGVGLDIYQMKENINQMYQGGVTSVLDLGSPYFVRHIPKLPINKPKIFYAISIITCRNGYPAEYMNHKFYKLGAVKECDNEYEIRKTVEKLYRLGVSCIKTAVVSRTFDGKPQVCWSDNQLQILTDEAHSHGLKVCAHITYSCDYAQAIRCGIDSIHHAAFDGMIDDRVLEEMVDRRITFVPTLSLADLMVTGLKEKWIYDPLYQPAVNDKIKENMRAFTNAYHTGKDDMPVGDLFIKVPRHEFNMIPKIQLENVKRFLKLGGKVALGTDSALGFSLHSTPIREIELLIEAGLSNVEAIKASTLTAASIFGKEGNIGSVEVGKFADLLIVDGDVSTNILALNNIKMVYINGKLVYQN